MTLYELLALRPAFDESDRPRLIDRVLHEPPTPPRRLDPYVPRNLETVVLKAMAKEPQDRFASAGALRDELRRFVEGRPIRSRPAPPYEQLWRWASVILPRPRSVQWSLHCWCSSRWARSISLAVVTAAAGRETVARRAAERSEEELHCASISPT